MPPSHRRQLLPETSLDLQCCQGNTDQNPRALLPPIRPRSHSRWQKQRVQRRLQCRRPQRSRYRSFRTTPKSINPSASRRTTSVVGRFRNLSPALGKGSRPAHRRRGTRQFPPCPPPAPRRSDRARHTRGKSPQSPSPGTTRPSRCSPTSATRRRFRP